MGDFFEKVSLKFWNFYKKKYTTRHAKLSKKCECTFKISKFFHVQRIFQNFQKACFPENISATPSDFWHIFSHFFLVSHCGYK